MRYLLGTLSDEERDQFEEMYFSDNAAFEEVEIAEGELVDRYVRGELSKSDHVRFETAVAASPRLAERVEFARVWKDKLTASSATPPVFSTAETYKPRDAGASWWSTLFGSSSGSRTPRLALAFSVLLLLLGGLALFAGWLRLREESRRLEAQRIALEQRQRELDQTAANLKAQAEQLAKGTPPQPSPTEAPSPQNQEQLPKQVLAVSLIGGSVRSGGGGRDVRITPPYTDVKFTLIVGDADYDAYQARVVTPDNVTVHTSSFSKPQRNSSGTSFAFIVPAKKLRPGDYTIKLDGRTSSGQPQSVEDYPFRVLR